MVRDRKTYIVDFFKDEIFEHCWIQIPKWKYNSLKLSNKIRAVEVKKEGAGLLSNITTKLAKYIEEGRAHFYEEVNGKEVTNMVELHVDDLYAYDENDLKSLPRLGKFGGNISKRIPPGCKPQLVFGQDEAIYRSS